MPLFLSKNLQYLRKLKSFTQKEMAEKMSITPSAYGNYENDYSQPNFEILETIIKILGVDAQDLLFSDLEKSKNGELIIKASSLEVPSIQDLLKQIEDLRKEIDMIKKQLKKPG